MFTFHLSYFALHLSPFLGNQCIQWKEKKYKPWGCRHMWYWFSILYFFLYLKYFSRLVACSHCIFFNLFYDVYREDIKRNEESKESVVMLKYVSAPNLKCSPYTDSLSDRLPYSMQTLLCGPFYAGGGVQGIWEYTQDLTFSQHKLDRVPIILFDLLLGNANVVFWQIYPRTPEAQVRLKWHPLMSEHDRNEQCAVLTLTPNQLWQSFSFSCCFHWDIPLNNNEYHCLPTVARQ